MLQITSKSYNDIYSVLISNKDMINGKLHFDSYVRYSKIFTANTGIIAKKLGELSEEKTKIIIDSILNLLEHKVKSK